MVQQARKRSKAFLNKTATTSTDWKMNLARILHDKKTCPKGVYFFLGMVGFCFLIFVGRISEYVMSEFYWQTNTYVISEPCSQCYKNVQTRSVPRKIPKIIHQIFFYETSEKLPQELQGAQQTWLLHHPDYQYILWNKTSIDELIDLEFPFLKNLYHGYKHWVRRADVARYIVLYHYGGWYVDLDLICKNSLETLEEEAFKRNTTVIVRETEPCGFSNDFIGITPNHPFLYSVLTALHRSNRWYIFPYANTMLSTGPLFMWGRYLNYPEKKQLYSIASDTYNNFIHLMHRSSWHSWDGVIVWFFFRDPKFLLYCIIAVSLLAFAALAVTKYYQPIRAEFRKKVKDRFYSM